MTSRYQARMPWYSPNVQSAQILVDDLRNGELVEHYRPLRSQPKWRARLVLPQEVTRVYRGLWGPERLVGPLLGPDLAHHEKVSGVVEAAYTPIPLRLDVTPAMRKKHRIDRWNIHQENAVWRAKPFKPPRQKDPLWCCLMMHTFTSEQFRPYFWLNPTHPYWDRFVIDQEDIGETFYSHHQPLSVTVAYVRLDLLKGRMTKRFEEVEKSLLQKISRKIPLDEWRPIPRRPEAPPKKYKVPKFA